MSCGSYWGFGSLMDFSLMCCCTMMCCRFCYMVELIVAGAWRCLMCTPMTWISNMSHLSMSIIVMSRMHSLDMVRLWSFVRVSNRFRY